MKHSWVLEQKMFWGKIIKSMSVTRRLWYHLVDFMTTNNSKLTVADAAPRFVRSESAAYQRRSYPEQRFLRTFPRAILGLCMIACCLSFPAYHQSWPWRRATSCKSPKKLKLENNYSKFWTFAPKTAMTGVANNFRPRWKWASIRPMVKLIWVSISFLVLNRDEHHTRRRGADRPRTP